MTQPHPPFATLITECFASTEFMALATNGPKGLWVNPVYFAWDKLNKIYFISQLDCTHMHNIAAVPQVACTIFPTNQVGDVFGAYVTGTARVLHEPSPARKAADDVYYGRVYPNDAEGKARDADGYRINPSWYFVEISIDDMSYFDTRYFEEVRTPVPATVWRG